MHADFVRMHIQCHNLLFCLKVHKISLDTSTVEAKRNANKAKVLSAQDTGPATPWYGQSMSRTKPLKDRTCVRLSTSTAERKMDRWPEWGLFGCNGLSRVRKHNITWSRMWLRGLFESVFWVRVPPGQFCTIVPLFLVCSPTAYPTWLAWI